MFLKPGSQNANEFTLVAPTGFEPVFQWRLTSFASRTSQLVPPSVSPKVTESAPAPQGKPREFLFGPSSTHCVLE